MRIESNQKLLINTELHTPDQTEEKQPKSLENNAVSSQGDSVRVSEYLANLRANQINKESGAIQNSALKAEDIAEIKAKVASGFYDTKAAMEQTVNKILDFYSPKA